MLKQVSDRKFGLMPRISAMQLMFFALGVLVYAEANPVPAKILGRYVFSYQPDGLKLETPEDLDVSNSVDGEDKEYPYDPEPAASNHNYDEQDQDYSAVPSASSNSYMTTYKTATKHDSSRHYQEDRDSDEDSRDLYAPFGKYQSKRKPPLIHSYKIFHGHGSGGHDYEEESDEDYDQDYRGGHHQVYHTKGHAVPISQHIEIETPVPVPYVKKIHVPIPQEVKVKIPHPVLVPVPRPYPVHIPVAQPVAVPDIKEITIPIERIVPYPVEKKIPVPIEKPVPYPIEKHVPVYLPQPIPVKVPIVKTIIHKVKQQSSAGPAPPPTPGFW